MSDTKTEVLPEWMTAQIKREREVRAIVVSLHEGAIQQLFNDIDVAVSRKTITKGEALQGLSYIDDDLADSYEEWIAEGA